MLLGIGLIPNNSKYPMSRRYRTFSQWAKTAGCTPAAVTKATKPGNKLHGSVVERDGKKMIDTEAPAAMKWRPQHRAPQPEEVEEIAPVLEAKLRKYMDFTLTEIIDKFGTMELFSSLLTAVGKIETIHAQRLKADQSTGELIPREFVRQHVLGLLERVFLRVQTDLPTTLASEVHTMCANGATIEQLEELIREGVSSELQTVKVDTVKKIKRAGD